MHEIEVGLPWQDAAARSQQSPLDRKAVLELVGVVLTLAIAVASTQVPHWFFLVPAGYLILLIGTSFGPALCEKGTEYLQARMRRKRLLARWDELRAQVETFYRFVKHDDIRSVQHLLMKLIPLLNEKEASGISQEQVSLIQGFLNVAEQQAMTLALKARRKPTDLDHARELIRDFELLVDSLNRVEIIRILRRVRAHAAWGQAWEEFWEGFKHFLRDYEAFARRMNREIGEEVFREYMPVG